MIRFRRVSLDDVLLVTGIVVLLGIASRLVPMSSDQAALIASECDLFYGSIDPATVPYCLAEMAHWRHLPTRDESILSPTSSSGQPSERRN